MKFENGYPVLPKTKVLGTEGDNIELVYSSDIKAYIYSKLAELAQS